MSTVKSRKFLKFFVGLAVLGMIFLIPGALYGSPSVSPASATIEEDETIQFTASDFGPGKIHWESSDESVATIDGNGKAEGVSPGTVTIEAKKGNNEAKATLTVVSPVLTSIDITPENPSINLGQDQQFTATGLW